MNELANLRAASAEEFKTIYEWMEKQFHAGELKYLSTLEALRAQDRYKVYGLWANENADRVRAVLHLPRTGVLRCSIIMRCCPNTSRAAGAEDSFQCFEKNWIAKRSFLKWKTRNTRRMQRKRRISAVGFAFTSGTGVCIRR